LVKSEPFPLFVACPIYNTDDLSAAETWTGRGRPFLRTAKQQRLADAVADAASARRLD
jgi:hypothetical protein